MLDFPNSPAVGDAFTGPGNVIWKWDGTKWVSAGGSGGGITEAPTDGQYYARRNASWYPAASANAYNNIGRNKIINPLFIITQRGGGPFTTSNYTIDQWSLNKVGAGAASITAQALTDTDRAGIGDEDALNCLCNVFTGSAAAGDFQEIFQPIEAAHRLAGKTVTLSFYAVASVAAMKLGIAYTQYFGSGGSPSTGISGTIGAATLTGSWARYSFTFQIPSMSGKVLGTNGNDYTSMRFCFSSGATNNAYFGNVGVQSGTILMWGVQLEVGTVPTPVEKLNYTTLYQQCQRFYQVGQVNNYGGGGSGAITFAHSWALPVQMRAKSTVTSFNNTMTNVNTASVSSLDFSFFQAAGVTLAAGAYSYSATFQATAEL